MKAIYSFILLVWTYTVMAQSSSAFIQSHVNKLTNTKGYIAEIVKRGDDGMLDFKPVQEEMSFKEQLIHLGQNTFWLSSTYIKEEPNPMKGIDANLKEMNREQLLSFFDQAFDYAIKVISEMDESTLTKEFNWNGGKLNKYQFLNLIHSHQSHHIGQLIVYLRLNGKQPPKYVGW